MAMVIAAMLRLSERVKKEEKSSIIISRVDGDEQGSCSKVRNVASR